MIGNTLALSRCNAGKFEIDYQFKLTSSNKPLDFMDDNLSDDVRYWPAAPFSYKGKFYYVVTPVVNDSSSGLGFRALPQKIVVVDNLREHPLQWTMRFIPLMSGTAGVGGSVVSGSYVYFLLIIWMSLLFDCRSRPWIRQPI